MAILKSTTIDDLEEVKLPVGTTAQRPSSPIDGSMRYNSTLNTAEFYSNGAWRYMPDIVRDNLALHLDAAEPASYPGTGTTWFDLSGNGRNGTINSGVSYNSGGYFVFDGGSNGYVSCSLVSSSIRNITMQAIVNMPASEGAAIFYNGATGGYGLGVGTTSMDIAGNNALGLFQGVRWIDTGVNWGTGWMEISLVLNFNSTPTIYKNGTKIEISAGTAPNTPVTSTIIGSDQGASRFFAGNIAAVKFYDRELSSYEISQNFNAIRRRYSI